LNCNSCGKENYEDALYCRYCGSRLNENVDVPPVEAKVGNIKTEECKEDAFSPPVEIQPRISYGENTHSEGPVDKPLGMKWYYFIINFQLWLFMLFRLAEGVQYILGYHYSQYGLDKAQVYQVFPLLNGLDLAFGVILLALIAFAFFTRRSLARYYRNGPKSYIALIAISYVLPIVYLVLFSAVTGVPLAETINANSVIRIVCGIVYAVLNVVYFRKRASMFG
jgi:hypothetical protein